MIQGIVSGHVSWAYHAYTCQRAASHQEVAHWVVFGSITQQDKWDSPNIHMRLLERADELWGTVGQLAHDAQHARG